MFELTLPWVLIAIPIPFLLWFLLPRAAIQLPTALKVPFFNAMQHLIDQQQRTGKSTRWLLPFLIWSLLLLALSGPKWVGNRLPIQREGHNIMLALDLSGSMELTDMVLHGRPASRLSVVKRAAAEFVKNSPDDKIGLILFGTQAYLQTPLTYDHHAVLVRIEDASVGLAGKTTSIGDAIGLAVKSLQHVPEEGRVIILLTDGVNNSGILAPLKAAELALEEHIKIYTIGLGSQTQNQLTNTMMFGMGALAELDEETLEAIATATGGHYFRATDSESLHRTYRTIHKMETVTQEKESIRPQHDYYAWPLSLAIILFLIWFNQLTKLIRFSKSKRES